MELNYQHRVDKKNDGAIKQIILARIADPVFCCSSSLDQIKDWCDCNDCGYDPIQKVVLTDRIHPCSLSSQDPPTSNQQTTNTQKVLMASSTSISQSTSQANNEVKTNCFKFIVSLCILYVFTSIIIIKTIGM